jgi:hypothetical protein
MKRIAKIKLTRQGVPDLNHLAPHVKGLRLPEPPITQHCKHRRTIKSGDDGGYPTRRCLDCGESWDMWA